MEPTPVSRKLLGRLPSYLHHLKHLPQDTTTVSATRIAEALGLGEVMVRKDLAKVSDGGRRKIGYVREDLIRDIETYLDVNSITGTIVVGAGKLGQALLDYPGFFAAGLDICAGFDIQPDDIRTEAGKPLYPMRRLESYCLAHQIRIAILTVPADQAQQVCDRLVACGIRAIWNFAPVRLQVPQNVVVQSENLAIALTALRMQLRSLDAQETA